MTEGQNIKRKKSDVMWNTCLQLTDVHIEAQNKWIEGETDKY